MYSNRLTNNSNFLCNPNCNIRKNLYSEASGAALHMYINYVPLLYKMFLTPTHGIIHKAGSPNDF